MSDAGGRQQVVVNWTAPIFGVVATYTVYRSSDGANPNFDWQRQRGGRKSTGYNIYRHQPRSDFNRPWSTPIVTTLVPDPCGDPSAPESTLGAGGAQEQLQ